MKTNLLKSLLFLVVISLSILSCKKDDGNADAGNCTDGIQNNGETGIDCGGICATCEMVCDDLISKITDASTVYASNTSSENCIKYREAIQAYIDQQCTTSTASYETIIDALGNCL